MLCLLCVWDQIKRWGVFDHRFHCGFFSFFLFFFFFPKSINYLALYFTHIEIVLCVSLKNKKQNSSSKQKIQIRNAYLYELIGHWVKQLCKTCYLRNNLFLQTWFTIGLSDHFACSFSFTYRLLSKRIRLLYNLTLICLFNSILMYLLQS